MLLLHHGVPFPAGGAPARPPGGVGPQSMQRWRLAVFAITGMVGNGCIEGADPGAAWLNLDRPARRAGRR